MVAIVIGALALVVVFVIAAAVVGRETHRLAEDAPRPVFDLDEAVAWVAEALPFEVAAELSHAEVRQLVTWSLEHLAATRITGNGHGPARTGSSVVATGETVDHLLQRASSAGLACTPGQVHAVVEAELGYFRAIGAMGPPEPPPAG